jgi:hypothetical protein
VAEFPPDEESVPSDLDDFTSSEDSLSELEERRREARKAVDEAGGGESEGFELAEEELIEHTSHGDEHSTAPIMRDADLDDLSEAEEDDLYGEADEELKAD